MNTDKRILSIVAFALFISGVVAPLIPRAFGSEDISVIFAIVVTVLALVLGALSRGFLLGKVAAIGALVVCIIGTINYVRFCSDRDSARRAGELRLQAEQQAVDARKH